MTEVSTGDVAETMSAPDAHLVTGYIRRLIADVSEKLDTIGKQLVYAYEKRAWVALGYESWDAYVSAELRTDRLRLDRDDRQDLVVQLRSAGMTTRAIGSAVGVHHDTVAEDIKRAPVGNPTPDSVTGTDGKTYPSSPPVRDEPLLHGEGERRTASAGADTPRAQDELPDDATSPVEGEGAPAPSVTPSEAVTEYLNGSQSVQDAKYLAAFAAAIARSDDFLQFDAERIGRLCDGDDLTSVEQLLDSTERFLSAMRRARSGLRVVNGGKA